MSEIRMVDMDDHQLARHLATEAGRLLVQVRAQAQAEGLAPGVIKDEGDRRSNELLFRLLAEVRPDDAVLSEEAADDLARVEAERCWIIDPLDGTREFGEPGRPDWAVHVALVENGELTVGAVGLPARDLVHATDQPTVRVEPVPAKPRILVSRSRPPEFAIALSEFLGGELVPMGSAGAKAMAVVEGIADVYAHAGGQYEWDSAAPVAVAHAAGLHTSRMDGSPLVYNQPNPWLPDLVICHQDLTAAVLAFLSDQTE